MRPSRTRPRSAGTLLAGLVALSASLAGSARPCPAQQVPGEPPPKAPPQLRGARVLAGKGEPHHSVLGVFLALRSFADAGADAVVLAADKRPDIARLLTERGASSVEVVDTRRAGWHRRNDNLARLATCRSLWFDAVPAGLARDRDVQALLRGVAARGAVVGIGTADANELLATIGLPDSELHSAPAPAEDAQDLAADRVHWFVPDGCGLVLHHGRRAIAYGPRPITVVVPANGDWPERRRVLDAVDVYDFGDVPSYSLDLLSWQRSARDRTQPVFPPAKPAPPQLASGALLLSGGGGVSDAMFRRFLDRAGGDDADVVCIPSASSFDPGEAPRSYSAGRLRKLGANRVTILHCDDPRRADGDADVHRLLQRATGVWIDGGRTFQFMDAFQGTRAHALLHDVLRRDGVVGGSSAGCQLIGELLVRGNPRTNKTLIQPGYTRALGLLPGVVVDAHFRQRDRQRPFAELVARHPQLLGIGLDEGTAIWVEGSAAEVLGKHVVSTYDRRRGEALDLQLRAGDRIDLVTGKRLD